MSGPEKGIFGPEVDEEINQTWRQVEDRVIQMAGGDRSKINPNLSIDLVLSYLDKAQTTDKKAAEKYGTIRTVFNNTLQCIQTVGGIVADGASYAFAPAGTCYNALTFVITAWQGYEGIFESLASLLEKCTEFLDRLRYYSQSGMDSKLTKVACQHLQIFVDICDRSLKLKSKRHKFAAFMKQMFLNDDGVQDLLSTMNKLIDKERGLVAAQTWKSSNEAASYSRDGLTLTRKMHNTIVEDKNLQKREKEAQKWKHTIVDALELDHKILQEDSVEWEKAWKRHRSKILEGSGEWLIKDSRFSQWIEGIASPLRIIGLEGGDGAGKTLLASNVILHLRKMKTLGSSRVIVAHNFLELDTKSSAPTDTAMVISKNLMCQLAFGYDPVLKNFAAICERSVTFTSPLDMVTKLLLQNEDLANLDVTFFLVLDGLGANVDTFAEILKKFSTNVLVQKTRILLTGTQELFNTIEKTGGVSVDKIILGEPNKQDVELFINHRMDNMEMLKDASRPGVSDMREKILENLLTSTNGDFYKINRVLDNIAHTDDVDDIISLLETAGEARPDQIEADIENLNQTRTTKEISEINEIILWIWAGWRWISPVEMEGIMALMPGNRGTSLMSMETKIKTKYTIFTTDYDEIDFKIDEMLDKIPLKKRDPFDENSSSGFKEIQPAEINIVKHYISTVCPPDLYKKFGFEEFFNLKMGRKGNYVHRDPDNGHITIVIRCLTCLVETRSEKTELLLDYASTCVRWHMEMTDLSLADRELKSEAGELLVRLFTERYGLDSLFSFHTHKTPTDSFDYETPVTWESWIRVKDDATEGIELISKWFNDSAVIEKVKSHPLVTAFKADGANKHLVLYEEASKGAAEDLFVNEATIDEKFFAFSLLYSLLARKDESVAWDADSVLEPTLDIVQSVEGLAETILKIKDKNANWEAQAASLVAGLPGDKIPTTVAIERATKALELDPTNWSASWTLFKSSKSDETAAALEKVIDQLMENKEWRDSNERHRAFLAMMLFDLGKKYWESEDTREKAIQMYAKVLEIEWSFSILKPYFGVLKSYSDMKMFTKIISFFEELLEVTTNDGHNLAATFVGNGLAKNEYASFISVLASAIESTSRYDLLKTIMEKIKEIEFDKVDRFLLGRNYAEVLSALSGHEDEGLTVLESLMVEGSESNHIWVVRSVVDKFVTACKKLATSKDIQAEEAQEYDKKIQRGWELCESKLSQATESVVHFALYWRARGNEKLAKKLLITPAKESLELLYDDDTENDMVSFWYFSLVFATLRDTENNLVAWHMMEQSQSLVMAEYERKLEAWKEQQEAATAKSDGQNGVNGENGGDNKDDEESKDGEEAPEPEPEPVKPDISIANCDGCKKDFIVPDGIWVCLSEGGMTHLCEDCYPKLKAGEVTVCSKDHEHYHLVRDDEKMARVPKGSVLVGERIITLEEWKQEIKATYVEYDDSK